MEHMAMQTSMTDPGSMHGYLTGALQRAGLPPAARITGVEQVAGSALGSRVVRLRCGATSYVVKVVPTSGWRSALGTRGGEAALWLGGVTRGLPPPVTCPVIDASHDPSTDVHRLLMLDVAGEVRQRGALTTHDSERLFSSLAVMHARQSESSLRATGLLPRVSETLRLVTHAVLHLAGRRTATEPWVHCMLDEVWGIRALVPLLLDVLGPRLADAYLDLAADQVWHARLDALPATLLHGDLHSDHIALGPTGVQLLDWEFAAIGPAAIDLQQHCLLHHFCGPPDGTRSDETCTMLRGVYADAYDRAGGRPLDPGGVETAWKLGWIAALCRLGFRLAEPLSPDGGDAATRRRVGRLCQRALQRALDYRQDLGV